jgi:hypothetical protein
MTCVLQGPYTAFGRLVSGVDSEAGGRIDEHEKPSGFCGDWRDSNVVVSRSGSTQAEPERPDRQDEPRKWKR